jgi:hypothetical protein
MTSAAIAQHLGIIGSSSSGKGLAGETIGPIEVGDFDRPGPPAALLKENAPPSQGNCECGAVFAGSAPPVESGAS